MGEKVLLHCCCVVCAGYSIEKLISLGFKPVLFWYNPNIYPMEEYEKRLCELEKYAQKLSLELIVPEQKHDDWVKFVQGLENEKEGGARCLKCFEYRLNAAAKEAKKQNISKFTTTLTISPHKNSKNIFVEGNKAAEEYGVEFLEIDFKKQNGFIKTIEIAKRENFYRQKYCGCEYALRMQNSEAII